MRRALLLPFLPFGLAGALLSAAPASAQGAVQDAPLLSYQADAPRDDVLTENNRPAYYSGRWVGTWYGSDGRSYSGEYHGRFEGTTTLAAAAPTRPGAASASPRPAPGAPSAPLTQQPGVAPPGYRPPPDPALYGTGTIANGWYYPPAMITTTVTKRAPVAR